MRLRVLIVLAVSQIIGWGTVGLLSVVARDMSADLNMSMTTVFAGGSIFFIVMGLCAPFLASQYARFGVRRLMIGGTAVSSCGFVVLGLSNGAASFFGAWILLGAAGAATLTTSAHVMLNEISGRNAKGDIGALMLMTGLSSSIFWPLTAFLAHWDGWRLACFVYCGMLLFISLPLYLFGLPQKHLLQEPESSSATYGVSQRESTFYLIVSFIALNAFVTFGLSAIFIELLKAQGLSDAQAISFATALGVIQVGSRFVDVIGGNRWDGVTTGIVAGLAMIFSFLLLGLFSSFIWGFAAFILLYGMGSGALAVSRATVPLVFYDKGEYATAISRIALPLNLISALAPPVMIGLLSSWGSAALLVMVGCCATGALALLLVLSTRRRIANNVQA